MMRRTKRGKTMRLPLQVSFQNVPHTPEAEAVVRELAEQLDEFAGDIMSCRVVVDMPHRHRRHGNLYQVRIDLTLANEEIAVGREPPEHEAAKNFRVAVTEAFDTAVRQLQDYVRRRRQAVKAHEAVSHARVAKLFPNSDYGFLETREGREIYFHRNSVLDGDFDDLRIGMEVRFVEEEGDRGPQASTVKIVGRHHHVL